MNPEDTHKPWIVLINGLFAGRQSWNRCADHLQNFFRVLTYDGKGQGEGPRPNHAYHFSELVADLQNLLMSLKIDKSSFWASAKALAFALKFAELAPNQVEPVIAADIPRSPRSQ